MAMAIALSCHPPNPDSPVSFSQPKEKELLQKFHNNVVIWKIIKLAFHSTWPVL